MISVKTIENVKNVVKIRDIVEDYVKLRKSGRRYAGCCPFHNEKTPSFFISEEDNFYKCFGCGEAGDSISFIEKIENVGFLEAIEIIAKKYNINIEKEKYSEDSKEQDYNKKKKFELILERVNLCFLEKIWNNEKAMKYLNERGINEEMAKIFKIGYSDGTLGNILKKEGYNDEDLIKIGVINKNKEEVFHNRLIIPLYNSRGNIIGFSGRTIESKNGEIKYINSADSLIFHKGENLFNLNMAKNEAREEKKIYLVEGYFDVISLYNAGIKNVVASCGTSLTDEQCKLLKRYADLVIILYDSDDAGEKASVLALEKLLKNGLTVNCISLKKEKYKDPDELVKNIEKNNVKKHLLELETDFVTFLARKLENKTENEINEKNKILHNIYKIAGVINDDIYKKLVIKKIKDLFGINLNIHNTEKIIPKKMNVVKKELNNTNILEQYGFELLKTLLKNINKIDEKNRIEIWKTVLSEIKKFDLKNDFNIIIEECEWMLENCIEINAKNILKYLDELKFIDENELKKKIIKNIFEDEGISEKWMEMLNINRKEDINDKVKNSITRTVLRMKLYAIKKILLENSRSINKDNNVLKNIDFLKNEEMRIAKELKVVIF